MIVEAVKLDVTQYTVQYELLRSQVIALAGNAAPGDTAADQRRGVGLALFLSKGMPEWIETVETVLRATLTKIAQHSISNRARCDVCRRKLESGEPVFRARVLYRVRPVCRSCASIELTADGQYIRHQCIEYNRSVRCEYCDRPIRHYCSRECQNDAAGERRKQRRALKRKPKPCAMCGQLFKPRRMDSQYCSAACKQAAYRRRSQTTGTEVAP